MSSDSTDVLVTVNDLSWTYFEEEEPALSHVTFEVRRGEVIGILGPALAGKTSLCFAITGLIPHDFVGVMEGTVEVAGRDTRMHPVHELSVQTGLVLDNPDYQFSQATVEEEIALGMENRGVAPEGMTERIQKVLKTVGLSGFEKRSPFELSGGQQQRLAIAAVLVTEPPLLILDEPTSFLDPVGKHEVYKTVTELNGKGTTIIIADHEVEYMAEVCDRLLVLDHGKIVFFDSPKNVFTHVEELNDIGLRVPQVTEVAKAVVPDHELGLPVSVEEAVLQIRSRLVRK